ncbi:MAG TPA: glycosyl hydrolase-related protein [Gemmatimonadaceae bacterium]|nr:glycosyl hydrolase-related protein [Gemmatimonadaceae bacterium]
MPSTTPPTVLHVVAHTHWDREWYHPAGRFRQRLVALVDELLDDTARSPFLLDGQAIAVEDYLAVRGERRDELASRLDDGSIEAGPWYVLGDELIAAGEVLVRNLLAGRRVLGELGARAMPVMYSPDAFGHPAALPEIAAGFGLGVIVLWRGYGGARVPAGDTVRWRSASGASALVVHLPPTGYDSGANLPVGADEARIRTRRILDMLVPRARTGALLLLNGADHHARQLHWREAVDAFAAEAAATVDMRVQVGSLASFALDVVSRATQASLPEVRGELRDSYGYAWALQGTFASRASQKRANALVTRALLRDAEPWAALARLQLGVNPGPVLRSAWRTLLTCHPHDTLCGCSVDDVARAMDVRLADAAVQADGVREDAIAALLEAGREQAAGANDLDHPVTDATSPAEHRPSVGRPVLVIRNSLARRRGGVAECTIDSWLADVNVGPGSAPPSGVRDAPDVHLAGGILLQRMGGTVADRRIESPRDYPRNFRIRQERVLAWVPPMDGHALRVIPVLEGTHVGGSEAAEGAPVPVRVVDRAIDNGLLRVTIVDGRVELSAAARESQWAIPTAIAFEDVGDRGDLYTHSRFGRPVTLERCRRATVVHAGPLRATLRTKWMFRIPSRRDDRLVQSHGRSTGGAHDLDVRLSLDAGSPALRVHVRGRNIATDHRLRIRFATGVTHAHVLADAAFGPVEREPLVVPPADRMAETPPRTAPLHRYVTLAGSDGGCTIVSDGLAEVEAADDGAAVLITLVRAVGELSRNDLPERPGHAGWPVPTPGAQCIGEFEASFAIVPHRDRQPPSVAEIDALAAELLSPLAGGTMFVAGTPEVADLGGVTLEGDQLACTTLAPADDDGWIVARCVNLSDAPATGRWRFAVPVHEARLARLDEQPLSPLIIEHNAVAVTVAPRAVLTLLVR